MVELRRAKTRMRLSPTVWAMTLELARLCGWNPLGTRQSSAQGDQSVDALQDVRHLLSWQTEYVSSDGQLVTAPDAMQLALGLNRATLEGDRLISEWIDGRLQPAAVLRTPSTGFGWFITPEGKDHLQKIARFCQVGEFQIY